MNTSGATATYEVRDDIAIVTLDNPPVNALGWSTRKAVIDALDRAEEDPAVIAIVLTGAGRAFSAGADIREFNGPMVTREPSLWTVLDAIESCTKPVVAAINSSAFGGGLEAALAAHYRLATADATIGLLEVTLGILPGAGGTQRLPRAVGLERALNMIVNGTTVRAEDLENTRLFDRVLKGLDLLTHAVAFAGEVGRAGPPLPRIRDWKIDDPNAEAFIEFARPLVAAASPHVPAPLKCVEGLKVATTRSFDEGLVWEKQANAALVETSQSKALRHAFFAERETGKLTSLDASIARRPTRSVGIVGAGTMGAGIAMNFLDAGIAVTLIDTRREALERGAQSIRSLYEGLIRKSRLTTVQFERRMALLQPSLSFEDISQADLIIEAVFEDYSIKEQVFRQLDASAKPGALLATNTSTLDIDRLASMTRRPQDVLGLHFFSPAHVMKLLEVIRGRKTATDVIATALALARRLGKTPVVSGVCEGFIGNRMLAPYLRQAGFLLDEGALPGQVDRAIESFGFAMGPFRVSDLAGNDIGWAIRKRQYAEQPDIRHSRTADLLCEHGRFGQKTGAGWYNYKPGDRNAYPSRDVEDLIVAHSRSLGIERRRIADEEIVGRLVYALVNEGARVVEEGIAARASDIDVVYLNGYGFPRWRGGPMMYADTVGPYCVCRSIRRFAARTRRDYEYQGNAWEPAPLLVRLAESGCLFSENAA